MNKVILPLAALIIGLAIGYGVGQMAAKPKIEQSQKELEQLTAQMEKSKVESEETIQKAAREIAKYQNELSRTKGMLTQTVAQLSSIKTQLDAMKAKALSDSGQETTQPARIINPAVADDRPAGIASTVKTAEYTIKDGDSFWKIAEENLGNGLRYKEILELNPSLSENQPLTVGKKIKIPAQ